jgi:hypothetical protein
MGSVKHLGRGALAVTLGVGAAVAAQHGLASADPSVSADFSEPFVGTPRVGAGVGSLALAGARGPVALNGRYVVNWALDRQTVNGSPAPGIPFATDVRFSTACDASGCVARSSLVAQDVPFDFRWTGDQWQSVQHFQWTCSGQGAPATVTYTVTPNPNGTLSGTRTALVDPPGCGASGVPAKIISPLTAVPA